MSHCSFFAFHGVFTLFEPYINCYDCLEVRSIFRGYSCLKQNKSTAWILVEHIVIAEHTTRAVEYKRKRLEGKQLHKGCKQLIDCSFELPFDCEPNVPCLKQAADCVNLVCKQRSLTSMCNKKREAQCLP